MNELKIIMTKGLPASGKSTWAKEFVTKSGGRYKRINKDDLRVMLDNGKWSKNNESFILSVRDQMIIHALNNGISVIVDDTNFAPKHEKTLRDIAYNFNGMKPKTKVEVEIKDFTDVSVEECIKRDANRTNSVGAGVIRQMYNQYLRPKNNSPELIVGVPKAIICDIDGTLALFGDNSPYDRDFNQDVVSKEVREIVNIYHSTGTKVIIVSGRKNKYLEVTEKWLKDNSVNYDEIFMPRADNDMRKDYILKEEIYRNNIQGKYNVFFVLDDRSQVVRLWRDLGIKTLQVADGDF